MSLWGNNSLDNIDIQFLDAFIGDASPLRQAGIHLAFTLAVISLTISVGLMLLSVGASSLTPKY